MKEIQNESVRVHERSRNSIDFPRSLVRIQHPLLDGQTRLHPWLIQSLHSQFNPVTC